MIKVFLMRSQFPDARIQKECEILLKNGFCVTIVGWDRGRLNYPPVYNKITQKCLRINVEPKSLKVAFYLPIWWLYVVYTLSFADYDIVHVSDFDTFFPAILISKIRRKPIIYDIFDFYAEMISFPILSKTCRALVSNLDKCLMRFADAVIIADDSRIEQIGKNANKNIISIYNCPVDRSFSFGKTASDKFLIFYGGAVFAERNLEKMILAIRGIDDIELIVMGPSSSTYAEKLKNLSTGYNNIKLYLSLHPYEDILRFTSYADLLFALYDLNVPNNKFASPNKLFEAMMFGKPIIVNGGTSMAKIVKAENCGIVLESVNVDEIRETIIYLKGNKELMRLLGNNGRKAYESRYNWDIMGTELIKLYKLLVDYQDGP